MLIVALFVFSLLYHRARRSRRRSSPATRPRPADVERIRASLGLDRPFLVRFGEWLWQHDARRPRHLDLHQPAGQPHDRAAHRADAVADAADADPVAIVVAIPLGVMAAWKHGTWIDRCVMVLAVFGFSTPVFVVGYLLAYVFALQLDWLPVQGFTPISQGLWPFLRNLILPAVALGWVYIALLARITRATMLDVLSQDYVRTAKAKGVGQRAILFVHALKNAAVPIVTIDRHRLRAADRRRGGDRERVRHSRPRPADGRCDPAARLSGHPGRRAAVQLRLRAGEPGGRPALHRV